MKHKEKLYRETLNYEIILICLGLVLFGFLLGCMFVYKVEINTINQALNSLDYCYRTFGGFP